MNATDVRIRAMRFLNETVSQLKSRSFAAIQDIPEYPASTKIDLGVPGDLVDQKCMFVLMKDTLPDGTIRVAVQYARPRFFGVMTDMGVDGFVISADGAMRELSQQDCWDLT